MYVTDTNINYTTIYLICFFQTNNTIQNILRYYNFYLELRFLKLFKIIWNFLHLCIRCNCINYSNYNTNNNNCTIMNELTVRNINSSFRSQRGTKLSQQKGEEISWAAHEIIRKLLDRVTSRSRCKCPL